MLGVDQFFEFIFTYERQETCNDVDLNYENTDEMEMWSSWLQSQFKQLQILALKNFQGFNAIWTHDLPFSAAVLLELSYEDPYARSRTIYQVHHYLWKFKYDMGVYSSVGAAFFMNTKNHACLLQRSI